MSHRLQYYIAKKIIVSTFFVVQLFGLWPYKSHVIEPQIEHSVYSVIYSVVVPIFTLYAYVSFGSDAYSGATTTNATFSSWTMKLVVLLYSYMVIVSYISLYIVQHLHSRKTKLAYFKFIRVADCMKGFQRKSVDIKLFIAKALFKTIIYDVFYFALFYYSLSVALATYKIQLRFYTAIFIYLPIFAIRLYANVFYEGILIANVFLKQLNYAIKDILTSINAIGTLQRNCEQNQILYVEELDQLNCEFEKVSMIYFEVVDATRSFNAIFGFHNMLWITMQLDVLIINSFSQFVAIVHFIVTNENSLANESFSILCVIIMSSYEIFTTTHACNSLVKEV